MSNLPGMGRSLKGNQSVKDVIRRAGTAIERFFAFLTVPCKAFRWRPFPLFVGHETRFPNLQRRLLMAHLLWPITLTADHVIVKTLNDTWCCSVE